MDYKLHRKKEKKKNWSGLTFLALPHIVLDHKDFIGLSKRALKLLIDISSQYRGKNNGDLCASFSVMQKRGWSSNDQLRKALDELIEQNFIILTRQGGRKNPSLYAISWQPIDDCGGKLDIKETKLAPRSFR